MKIKIFTKDIIYIVQGNSLPFKMKFVIQSENPRTFQRDNFKFDIYIFRNPTVLIITQCAMINFPLFLFDHRKFFWISFSSSIIFLGTMVNKAKHTILDIARDLKMIILPCRYKCLMSHFLLNYKSF